ncbi:hypothetical protein CerSpe_273620 [Prunus speciosa]
MRKHQLKMNSKKCLWGFGWKLLGIFSAPKGVEIDKNKSMAIIDAPPSKNKKWLQSLLGQMNFLQRFIANLAGKVEHFSSLLKLKEEEQFRWEEVHQKAFDSIKEYLTKPSILIRPKRSRPLKLYISAVENSLGNLLAQDNDDKKEQGVYYLIKILTATKRKYSPIEKLCLALYIKYMLTHPSIRGQIGKWTMTLAELTFRFVSQQAVKGQALANFLATHPCVKIEDMDYFAVNSLSLFLWRLYFNESRQKWVEQPSS